MAALWKGPFGGVADVWRKTVPWGVSESLGGCWEQEMLPTTENFANTFLPGLGGPQSEDTCSKMSKRWQGPSH